MFEVFVPIAILALAVACGGILYNVALLWQHIEELEEGKNDAQ